jgi:hypothetical protein
MLPPASGVVRQGPARVITTADKRHAYVGDTSLSSGAVTLDGWYLGVDGDERGAWSWPLRKVERIVWDVRA